MPRPKNESYIIDLCDELLNRKASRGCRFDFLRGDPGRHGRSACLPVDAYYADLNLVVEYHEKQHSERVALFDRRIVASGETRGAQRQRYDGLRCDILPKHGIELIVLDYREFDHNRAGRLRRNPDADRAVLRVRLARFLVG